MKTRNEINFTTASIQAAIPSYTGGETIRLNGIETTITQLNEALLEKLTAYEKEEKSLKSRAESLENLKIALHALRDKQSYFSWTVLPTLVEKVDRAVEQTLNMQKDVDALIPTDVLEKTKKYVKETCLLSKEAKLEQISYRVIKNVDRDSSYFLEYFLNGSLSSSPFVTLKTDLEVFLTTYQHILNDQQRSHIAKIISIFESSSENVVQLDILYSLFNQNLNENDLEKYINAKSEDVVSNLEKSISKLEKGMSILIPGGVRNHAILFQIQRVKDQEYEFAIFNTGLKSDFGQIPGTEKPKQKRVVVFSELPIEAVIDQQFLTKLLRFSIDPITGDLWDLNAVQIEALNQILSAAKVEDRFSILNIVQMNALHRTIVKQFTETYPGKQSVREPHYSQTWGTCAFDSIAAFLEYELEPSLYIPFQYDMMLRAKAELNGFLNDPELQKRPNGELFLEILDYLACNTILEWKYRFEEHCTVTEDLLIAREAIEKAKLSNDAELKEWIEKLSATAFALDRNVDDKYNLHNFIVLESLGAALAALGIAAIHVSPMAGPAAPLVCGAGYAGVSLGGYVAGAGIGKNVIIKDKPIVKQRTEYIQFLNNIENVLKKISPEQAAILELRLQSLTPSVAYPEWDFSVKNRPTLQNLKLEEVLHYLQYRYAEIAMCVPALLDPVFSPLREGIQGCQANVTVA